MLQGTSRNEQSTLDSGLRRPSLAGRLLGKRKASTPVTEQPYVKRSTTEPPCEQSADAKSPTYSFSDTPVPSTSVETSKKSGYPEPESGDGTSSIDNSDVTAVPGSNAARDSSVQNAEQEPEEVVSLDDSDSSSEVDLCDAPLLVTPKKDPHVSRIHTPPKKPASPANAESFTGGSPLGKDKSPVQHVSKSPLISNTNPASASGSPTLVGSVLKSQSRSVSSVPCHYCPKTCCQSAVKTCLMCGASMCSEHLRPHLESPVFQNHTLVPPVEDISSWRCQEHHEINRIYCRQCGVCVCTVCTVIGSHRDHVCISIREAERELRVSGIILHYGNNHTIDIQTIEFWSICICLFVPQDNLKEDIKQLQETEEKVKQRLKEFTKKKDTFKVKELTLVLSKLCMCLDFR